MKTAREIGPGIPELRSQEAIDAYVEAICKSINEIAEKSAPVAKSGGVAHSFWNWERIQATTEASARRCTYDAEMSGLDHTQISGSLWHWSPAIRSNLSIFRHQPMTPALPSYNNCGVPSLWSADTVAR